MPFFYIVNVTACFTQDEIDEEGIAQQAEEPECYRNAILSLVGFVIWVFSFSDVLDVGHVAIAIVTVSYDLNSTVGECHAVGSTGELAIAGRFV